MPNQFIPESEWNEDYYKRCAQAIINNYISDTYAPGGNASFYQSMADNIRLYMGEQSGHEWEYMRQTIIGDTTSGSTAIFTPGMESRSIMDTHISNIAEFVANMDKAISTRSIFGNRNSKKSIVYDLISFRNKFSELSETLNEAGVRITGLPYDINTKAKSLADQFIQENFKEDNEELAYYLAITALKQNDHRKIFKASAKWSIICGLSGIRIENTNVSPIPTWNTVAPLNLIKDRRRDDEFGMFDQYVGSYEYMPIEYVIKHYNLNKDQAEKLRLTGQNQALYTKINKLFGLDMFTIQGNIGCVAVANIYWRSYVDSRIRGQNKPDSYGNYHIKEIAKDSGASQLFLNTIRQATLIGGEVCVNYGQRANIPINSFGSIPPLPILTVMPNMTYGWSNNMGDLLKGYQAQLDQYVFKLQQAVSTDYGKQLFIDPAKMDSVTNAFTTLIHMRTDKVHEINKSDGFGEKGLPVEMQDFSLSPTVQFYMEAINAVTERMRMATNTPATAQGLQNTLIGKSVQEMTMTASNKANFIWQDAIINNFAKVVQYTVDQARINIASTNKEEFDIPLNFGDVKTVKLTPKMAFEQIGVYVTFDNMIDTQTKTNLMAIAQSYANANAIPPDTISKMMLANTLTEVSNILGAAYQEGVRQKQSEMAAAAAENAMIEEMRQKGKMDVAREQTNMAAVAGDKRKEIESLKQDNENGRKITDIISGKLNNTELPT